MNDFLVERVQNGYVLTYMPQYHNVREVFRNVEELMVRAREVALELEVT